MLICPFCKGDVHEEATKCRHCGSSLGEEGPKPASTQVTYVVDRDLIRFAKFALSVLAVFVVAGAFLYGFDIRDAAREIRSAREDIRTDRDAIKLLKTEVTKLRDEAQALATGARASVSQATARLAEMEGRVKSIESLAADAEKVSAEIETHVHRVRSRVSTVEKILTTVEIRSRSSKPPTESSAETLLTEFYSRHRFSVLTVLVDRGWASGLIVSDKGHVLTADYVVEAHSKKATVVAADGTELNAEILVVDRAAGLALLKIQPFDSMGVLPLADDVPTTGTSVVAIGAGRQRDLGSIEGTVSKVSTEWLTVKFNGDVAGFGGGPVLTLDGQTVGIVYRGPPEENTNECKRSDAIKSFLVLHGVQT